MNCGGCTACCTHLDVSWMNAPSGVDCIHQCKSGCGIYESRPEYCKTFDCAYKLSDSWPENLRPDKTGVIFERIYTRIYIALISEPVIKAWDSEVILNHIYHLNNAGISVIACSLKHGILRVFDAEEHDPNMVVKLAMEATK